jgi:ubiquinone/menaquinone biosynthesis C-methylase UbiE
MGLKFEKIFVWGRSTEEYIRMFSLTPQDLALKILDCASGPASFNAEMTRKGCKVVSCDPIYKLTSSEIAQRIQEACQPIMDVVQANINNFVWQTIQSPKQLEKIRMAAMQAFIEDFSLGIQERRYVAAQLPILPFADQQFDLALCSHFLFLYSDHFSEDFHLASIVEMCRVAQETRIFPIVNTSGAPSPYLQPVINQLNNLGYKVQIRQVSYEFQKGANTLLQVLTNSSS